MSTNHKQWPWMDFGPYLANRPKFPPDELARYYGKHIAWNLDGTRIVAGADTEEKLYEQLRRAGIDLNQVIGDYIDPPDVARI